MLSQACVSSLAETYDFCSALPRQSLFHTDDIFAKIVIISDRPTGKQKVTFPPWYLSKKRNGNKKQIWILKLLALVFCSVVGSMLLQSTAYLKFRVWVMLHLTEKYMWIIVAEVENYALMWWILPDNDFFQLWHLYSEKSTIFFSLNSMTTSNISDKPFKWCKQI